MPAPFPEKNKITDGESSFIERTRDLSLDTTQPPDYAEFQPIDDNLELVQSPASLSSDVSPSAERSKWKTAFEEARHFAGGLVSRPVESTKHYSILRHSHGLVYYKGPSTNVAITIFADRPLAPDRTLWVQRKGWTGKTGMKAKALIGSNGSWVNVTPSERAEAAQLLSADERAWQRDISKFHSKAPKELKHHQVRETDILRIPAAVDDGYFRVVLCAGQGSKTLLCPSPVFRVASTSTSGSSIRGASIVTLPMEIVIKIGSSMAMTAAGNAIAPITSAIQSQVNQYQPSFVVQEASSVAYDATGAQNKIDNANQQYGQRQDIYSNPLGLGKAPYDELSRPSTIGPDSGPEPPYPIRMSSKVVAGTGQGKTELGVQTANLANIPDDVLVRLSGIYFGWAALTPTKDQAETMSIDWYEAIISIAPCPYTPPSITPKKIVKAYLLHDFQGVRFLDAKISIVVMGFLRPSPPLKQDREIILYDIYKDIAVTSASLSRLDWGVDSTLRRIKTTSSNRSITERYFDARQLGQRHVNSVPLHRAGIRGPGAELRDRLVGQGGIYVLR